MYLTSSIRYLSLFLLPSPVPGLLRVRIFKPVSLGPCNFFCLSPDTSHEHSQSDFVSVLTGNLSHCTSQTTDTTVVKVLPAIPSVRHDQLTYLSTPHLAHSSTGSSPSPIIISRYLSSVQILPSISYGYNYRCQFYHTTLSTLPVFLLLGTSSSQVLFLPPYPGNILLCVRTSEYTELFCLSPFISSNPTDLITPLLLPQT